MLSPIYVAGFFDGEGCATFRRCNRYQIGDGRRSPSYSVVLGFTNTDLGILQDIQQLIGGKIYSKSRKNTVTHAAAYELLLLRKSDVAKFISTVGPYVVVKAPQLRLVGEFLALPKIRLEYIGRGKTWPIIQSNQEDLDLREGIITKLRVLNKRGPIAS